MNRLNKSIITKKALEIGFDDIGFASANGEIPFSHEVKKAHEAGRFGPLDYLEKTLEARIRLKSVFPEAKSVIIVVKNYYTGDHPAGSEKKAKIARYAWGQDYHHWFKKKLKILSTLLLEEDPEARIWPFNDTGPFLERAWAYKAGLGFIGKSAMFIHRNLGTWTLLGGIATDVEITPDQAYEGPDCGSCMRCLEACPTEALIKAHTLDANKCISTWTIERSLHPSAIIHAPRDHGWLFGCDICQEVCPWNKFQKKTEEPRFKPVVGRVVLSKETLNQDLRGSALNRTKRAGLIANFLRIRKSLEEKNLKTYLIRNPRETEIPKDKL